MLVSHRSLEVSVAKLRQELPQRKRDGDTVSQSISRSLIFDEELSTGTSNGLLRQITFLPELARKIKEEPESVVKDLEEFRAESESLLLARINLFVGGDTSLTLTPLHMLLLLAVTKPENIRIAVSGSILSLPHPRSPWSTHFPVLPPTPLSPVPYSRLALSELGHAPSKVCAIASLSSIEGSYAQVTARGIQGWDHADFAALEVTKAVMNALESYLWKYIRGSGLAYGAGVTASVEAGTVGFYIYRVRPHSPLIFDAS